MPLHPLKRNGFILANQLATVDQTRSVSLAILDAMLAVEEDTKIPAGLRQVGRSAITEMRTSAVQYFDEITRKFKALQDKAEANLHLADDSPEVDLLDASITGEAISLMCLLANAGAVVFKAFEHLPKLNKQAPASIVSAITAALVPPAAPETVAPAS